VTDSTEHGGGQPRAAARASLYLAAALYCDGRSSAVRIRNMSARGALVDCDPIPDPGVLVQLVRGGLIVHALVVWSADGRCGLKFSGSVDVQQWRAPPANLEQQRVDEVVRLVKAGAVPLPVPPLAYPAPEEIPSTGRIADDLRRVAELLDQLGETLAGDAEIVEHYGADLQKLDIATQVIAAVNAVIEGYGDPDPEAAKLVALRRSADEALRRIA
jgi:hypothetical protein